MPLIAKDTCVVEWFESMRKEVECYFGRLTGRFRILKLLIVMRTPQEVDKFFHTCYILHIMLDEFDERHELEAGVHWAGQDGLHDTWVVDPLEYVTSVRLRRKG